MFFFLHMFYPYFLSAGFVLPTLMASENCACTCLFCFFAHKVHNFRIRRSFLSTAQTLNFTACPNKYLCGILVMDICSLYEGFKGPACIVCMFGGYLRQPILPHVRFRKERKERKMVWPLQFLQLGHLVSLILNFHNLNEQKTNYDYGCDWVSSDYLIPTFLCCFIPATNVANTWQTDT